MKTSAVSPLVRTLIEKLRSPDIVDPQSLRGKLPLQNTVRNY